MPSTHSGLTFETQATVSSCIYRYARLRDVDFESGIDSSYFLTTYTYAFEGRNYTGSFDASVPHQPGETISLWIDPSHPSLTSLSQPEQTALQIVIKVLVGVILAALLLFLFQHFGLDDPAAQ